MTQNDAIRRANEIGGSAIARPYEFSEETGEWTEWGVTDASNKIIPPRKDRSRAFIGYQKRFIET